MRLLVKVCGLVRGEDAAFAAAEGADLLGFVCHPASPRHCADLTVAEPFLARAVLVMVAEDAEAILAQVRRHGFRRAQPHLPPGRRSEAVAALKAAGLQLVVPWADAPGQPPLATDLYLWEPDPARTGLAGGSGQGHAQAFPPPGPFLLAGGLDAEGLAGRVERLSAEVRRQLRGVDAASRLECAPGIKDPRKVAAYLRAARALEAL